MPDMKLDAEMVDVVYTQLFNYYMMLKGMGREIPNDLERVMSALEDKFKRAAQREVYRKEKGYR